MIRSSSLIRTLRQRNSIALFSSGRRPLPPMPRQLPVAVVPVSKKSPPGTWLIRGGYFLLALFGIDNILQYQEAQEAQRLLSRLEHETKELRRKFVEECQNKPTLFQCQVKEPYGMGGSHGLQNARRGDVVDILEQNVGPDKLYHLCRSRNEKGDGQSVGWYPIAFLERKRKWILW